jgi:cell division control protein 6
MADSVGQGLIFKDREKLTPRYIPPTLPHREEYIGRLHSFFRDALASPSQVHLRSIQIIGSVGCGKTAVTRLFGDRLQAEARRLRIDLNHIYINLMLHGHSRVVLYRYLVQQAAPEAYSASLSAEELLYQLVKYLRERGRYLLITLDEIDYFIKHTREPDVIYDITRLEEISEPGVPSNVIGVVFTARSREFYKVLDEAALSTLGRIPLEFQPYTWEQIVDILDHRVKEAFQPRVVSSDVLEYVADITAKPPVNGDMRYALDLLLYSGNLAEYEGAAAVTPEHIRRVVSATNPSITEEDIANLPEREKLVLLGVVRALKTSGRRGRPYTSLKEIRLSTGVVWEEYRLKPLGVDEIEECVQDLHDRGIVEIKSLTSIGISGVPTEALDRFLDTLIERLKSGINGG